MIEWLLYVYYMSVLVNLASTLFIVVLAVEQKMFNLNLTIRMLLYSLIPFYMLQIVIETFGKLNDEDRD